MALPMTWQNLPPKLKTYIVLLTSLAVPIILYAGYDLFHHPYEKGWIVLAILTVLTVPFYLLLPSVSTIVGIGDAYVMAVAMLYGTSPCIAATLCHTLAGSLLVPNRPKVYPHRVVFNVASTVTCAWIYSNVYAFLNPGLSKQVSEILLPIVALTLTFFLLNSLSTATAISLATGQSILRFWSQNYLSLSVEFSVSAVSAGIIVTLYSLNPWVPLAAAPLIGVVWGWHKLNKAKAMEAERHLKEQEQLYFRTVESLALAVDAKDQTTYGHIRRVRAYAMGLAKLCGIRDPNELMAIETGSLLHDIGKLAIDDYILNKPGRLTKQEFEKMKIHSEAGDEILKQVQFPFPVSTYVRSHHERWDGLGYPDGLRGEQIPLGARILAIADAFDAIRSSRPYKVSFGLPDSIELLRSQSGTLYDPHLVKIFEEHIEELETSAQEAAKNIPELSFRKYFAKLESTAPPRMTAVNLPPLSSSVSEDLIQLIEFCSSLARYLETTEVMPILTQRIARIIPFTTCIFFLEDGDGTIRAAYVGGKFSERLTGMRIGLGKGVSGWVSAYGKPMINTGPGFDFQDLPESNAFAFNDVLSVPMIVDETCVGTISVYAESPITFTQANLDLLQKAAGHIAPLLVDAYKKKGQIGQHDLLDPISQTYRIAYLSVAGPQLIAAAEKEGSTLSLLLVEVTNFPQIASLYGAAVSDATLRRIADTLRAELRQIDLLLRYGYWGFIALLPGMRGDQAMRYAQRLVQQIRKSNTSSGIGHAVPAACRASVSSFPSDGTSVYALLEAAHRALGQEERPSSLEHDETDRNILEFPPRIQSRYDN
jgi:diguanylate cyclase (GGDEF)-like protein/putative nucleotidyltransferase with HDIG domain